MSLDFADEQLRAAVELLATDEAPLAARLQSAWDAHVQMVWMKPCLTAELLRRFKTLWETYTAPSDDPRSTALRGLDRAELTTAVCDLLPLSARAIQARASSDWIATSPLRGASR